MPILTKDIWERIAFYTLTTEPLGPPKGLTSLLLICNETYQALSFQNNTRLYALLFDFKFDTAAPIRRMNQTWLNSYCMAVEYRKRCEVLRRVKMCNVGGLFVDDLWTCFLMYLENDGKNEAHLTHSNLHSYLLEWTFERPDAEIRWIEDQDTTALLTWLWFMLCTRRVLDEESLDLTELLSFRRVHDLLVYGFKLSSTFSPSSDRFQIQDHEHARTPGKPHTITHYSHPLTLSAPLISTAAILAYVSRTEQIHGKNESMIRRLPETRAPYQIGPIQRDMREFQQVRVRLRQELSMNPDSCSYDFSEAKLFDDRSDECMQELLVGMGSTVMDPDWYRLVSCHPRPNRELRGAVYILGSSSGFFGGRFLVPYLEEHLEIIANPNPPPTSDNSFIPQPLYMRLREHHCFNPSQKLRTTDTDWTSAFWPKDCVVTEHQEYIEVLVSSTGKTCRYETYYPDGPNGPAYKNPQLKGGADTGGRIQSSGVVDILVTGDSGKRYDDAWGSFKIVGRIRVWDGLVTLIRIPEARGHGRWFFTGYFHNGNLAGRWRDTANAHEVGLQGSFAVTKLGMYDSTCHLETSV